MLTLLQEMAMFAAAAGACNQDSSSCSWHCCMIWQCCMHAWFCCYSATQQAKMHACWVVLDPTDTERTSVTGRITDNAAAAPAAVHDDRAPPSLKQLASKAIRLACRHDETDPVNNRHEAAAPAAVHETHTYVICSTARVHSEQVDMQAHVNAAPMNDD